MKIQNTIDRAYERDGLAFGLLRLLREQENENLRDVARFSQYYEISLLKISLTYENNKPELIYFFSDNLGGYTIDAIRKSLKI